MSEFRDEIQLLMNKYDTNCVYSNGVRYGLMLALLKYDAGRYTATEVVVQDEQRVVTEIMEVIKREQNVGVVESVADIVPAASAKEIAEKITFARTMIDHFVHGEEGMDALHEAHKALSTLLADYRRQSELLEEARRVVRDTRGLVCEGAVVGFNPLDGDWATALYTNNGSLTALLAKLEAGHDA